MDNGGNPSAGDQSRKEMSISLAASSMINASDVITPEVYQANLKRIQEVKEMVRRLEMNNEVAHKNFLVNQLEERAEQGREAEDMLARLRNQQGLSGMVQFTNNVPSDNSEAILPTTATLVEVPESYSSPAYSSSVPTPPSHPPQTAQQARPTQHQWGFPPIIQPYNPNVLRYYVPSSQHSPALHTQVPVDQGQLGWYMPNQPPQSRVRNPPTQTGFQPTQVQQPSQPWGSYPLSVTDPAGFHASTAGWTRTAPVHGGQSTGPSNLTYREPSFPTQPAGSRPPVVAHNQPLNLISQVQVPPQSVPVAPAKSPFDQPSQVGLHPKPAEAQSPVSAAVSKPVAISEFQRSRKLPQRSQQQSQPQLVPRLQSQVQQQQPEPQRLPQPTLQSQQHSRQAQPLSQRPPQPPQTHQQALPLLVTNHTPTSVPQSYSQPSQARDSLPVDPSARASQTQPSHPTIVQEQAQKRGGQSGVDQATFIKLFQSAVQRGSLQLKAFWFQAKASGITDEWFQIAIHSLPRNLWQSVVAQANQSGPTFDVPSQSNASQQQRTTSDSNAPTVSAPSPITATPIVQIASATQQVTQSSVSTGESTTSTPKQASKLYSAQLQYYAEQATKSALSAQAASVSKSSPGDIAPTQTMMATPTRDIPLVQANARTPKDANKSTLARDILRAFGKMAEKPRQEMGDKPADQINEHECYQPPEVTPSPLTSHPTSAKPPAVPLTTDSVNVISNSIPSAKSDVQDEPQCVTTQPPSMAKAVLKEEHGWAAVIEEPIMIDLTAEDSDESTHGMGQGPTFPMRSSASAAVPSQPASITNTTNHTPLLENLSLEEPSIDVAGASGNADVRMHSPSLSLPAEENMDSEPLYPPGDAEPVLSSEPNERSLDGQLPLFLPSPPASPAPTEPPATDAEMIVDESKSRSFLKRRSVEVDKVEIDTEMVTPPRVRKRHKRRVYVLIPPAPLYVKRAKMRERAMAEGIDLEGVGQDEELQYGHLEQLLIEESKLRLLERRCRWLNCGVILNCAANLLAHLKEHAREEAQQPPFLCRWASCQRQFSMKQERDVHLERHTIRPLPCPIAGCNKQFDQPVNVMQHEVQHQKADRRELLIHKPTCQPIVPAIPARLGAPPQCLPSHRVIPRRVAKCQISADRHAIVGPWVLWNIFSPVDLNIRKQNASMRGRPTCQAINYDTDSSNPRRDDYDFLLALSSYSAKDPQLDDLDSSLITMSAARGLTLWGSEATDDSKAGSVTGESTNGLVAVVDATVEGKLSGNEAAEDGQPERSVVIGEEDVVERMLDL